MWNRPPRPEIKAVFATRSARLPTQNPNRFTMQHRRLACLWLFLVLAPCAATRSLRAAEADSRNAALLSITSDELKQHVGALADDTFEGRASGTRGNRAAGIYIIERLKKCGLAGGGPKQSFYQSFNTYHNILALVEGQDPTLKEQTIVISAHYDHVGYGTSRNSYGPIGRIHNGADDNASGVAGLLEVAEAVCQLPQKPKRSILFAFWDGEEAGLIGSKYWVEHPTFPLSRVPIMINADMIGRLRDGNLVVYGTRTSRDLRRLVSRQNDAGDLLLDFNWDIKSDSDQYSFCSHDIPYLMVHTGMHGDYHRPSDDADKINSEGLKQVAQFVFKVLVALADAPELGGFRRQARNESHVDQQSLARPLPPLPGRLGMAWDENAALKGTIVVASVNAGSAAAKAGLSAGDKILKFAGREIHDVRQFRLSVLTAASPATAIIQRAGEAAPRELSISLPGQPVRLGISWRTDEIEPACVIVNRVVPGSPADLAGLRVNDRIHRVGDQEFADSQQFQQALAAAIGALTLEVETSGRLRSVEVRTILDQPAGASKPAASVN
jgi:hypothetical protein